MKQMVVYISEIVLCGLVVCFCLQMLFFGEKDAGLAQLTNNIANRYQAKEPVSENEVWLKQVLEMPIPEIRLQGGSYEAGEKVDFLSYVQIQYGETWIPVKEAEGNTLEILSIINPYGKNVREEVVEAGFSFTQCGRYEATVRISNSYGGYVVKLIPFVIYDNRRLAESAFYCLT